MKNTTTIITIILIIIMVSGLVFYRTKYGTMPINPEATTTVQVKGNIHDATFTINEEEVALQNGKAETSIPGSSASTTTTYFGNDVQADFDGNGTQDTAFIVTQNGGGSGTFYYLVASLVKEDGSKVGTYGYFLGDRIAPQANTVSNGVVTVSYADRKPTDSFAVAPSVMKSVSLRFNKATNQFEKVVPPNLAATSTSPAIPAAPAPTLSSKTWSWTKTTYSNGKVVTPNRTDKFKLTFKDKGFSISTDCNGIGGEYIVNGSKITFDKMISTLMYCEGSQEAEFTKMIASVGSYHFSAAGELIFDLKVDSGTMTFK